MFGSIGPMEILLIFVVALLLFGPRKLPEIGKSLGRAIADFRKASTDLRSTLEDEVRAEETRESARKLPPPAESIQAEEPHNGSAKVG